MSALFIAEIIVYIAAGYAACGIAFGIFFLCVGVQRVDPNAAGAGYILRLLWLPGSAALWPFLAARWVRIARGETS